MGNPVLTTYSGRDANFTLNAALTGPIVAAGVASVGLKEMRVHMDIERTVMETGMDGATAVSAVPGNWGSFELDVWQVSTLHNQLLEWYNALQASADLGDVTNWASSKVLVQNIVDGTGHNGTGVCPTKVPDKVYGTQARWVTWVIKAANITHT